MTRAALIAAAAGTIYVVTLGLFERLAPRGWVRAYQRTVNPIFRSWTGVAFGCAVIETTGRRSGEPGHTPVGGRLRRNAYWTVAGDGFHSDFVRNIQANPQVRVRVHGRWRTGHAHLLRDDPARRRLLALNPLNSVFVAIAARDPLTIRIDLQPDQPRDEILATSEPVSAGR